MNKNDYSITKLVIFADSEIVLITFIEHKIWIFGSETMEQNRVIRLVDIRSSMLLISGTCCVCAEIYFSITTCNLRTYRSRFDKKFCFPSLMLLFYDIFYKRRIESLNHLLYYARLRSFAVRSDIDMLNLSLVSKCPLCCLVIHPKVGTPKRS